ncbi:phosphoribosyl 1,2-cyclic phosphate phosphodiesterase [Chryseobacterium defluvii]|uniref:Phosphoribosyl 1,2-cyclic phosphate phosphodiesterase n=1 Tax=Chryseobacterium defluvii TaxID=160396 RepID=A0A840KFW9_9FLAO|nr:MBL fold metallo-hydrolase [Chryseobacterium defluvii]MBB4805832.1 phosphoribosyl 1,2-cyclic phosphate phosphodiesterase [Chryseobacterium defluvii]
MKLKFLGTGTSQGIPVIGCTCEVCTSGNPKDNRFRSSVMVTTEENKKILIDCGPDFRQQMLLNHEHLVDVILLTHEHNDHVIGLDDMRPLIFKSGKHIPIYCYERVGNEIKNRFPYAFTDVRYPGAPAFDLYTINNEPFTVLDTEIVPVEVIHYKITVFGYKFKNMAYITDANFISETEKEKLKNLDVLILNCIRKFDPHPAHFVLADVIQLYKELKPEKMFLTHISHHLGVHDIEDKQLPEGMHLAYDGLEIDF